MRTLLMTLLALAFAVPASAQFYGRAGLHGSLARCVDSNLDAAGPWAGCEDDHREGGGSITFEGGYAPTAWLDLGLEVSAGILSSSGANHLGSGYIMPVVRLKAPPVAALTPFVEAGYGYGVTSLGESWPYYRGLTRNLGGVFMVSGGLRWNTRSAWKPFASIRRLDYTGDPRTSGFEGSRRTNTWHLGIGVEFRP